MNKELSENIVYDIFSDSSTLFKFTNAIRESKEAMPVHNMQ